MREAARLHTASTSTQRPADSDKVLSIPPGGQLSQRLRRAHLCSQSGTTSELSHLCSDTTRASALWVLRQTACALLDHLVDQGKHFVRRYTLLLPQVDEGRKPLLALLSATLRIHCRQRFPV